MPQATPRHKTSVVRAATAYSRQFPIRRSLMLLRNRLPKGIECDIRKNMRMYDMHFFSQRHPCLFQPRIFSLVLGCAACRGGACTLRSKIGPRPGSVARALGVQRSQVAWSWLCARDCFPPSQSQAGPWKPQMSVFLFSFVFIPACVPVSHLVSFWR